MKLTIEPTGEFFMAGEVMVRLWRGTDEYSRPVVVLIAGIRVEGASNPAMPELIPIPSPTLADSRAWAEDILKK